MDTNNFGPTKIRNQRAVRPPIERFLEKIKISTEHFFDNTPCWEWQGSLNAKGYGKIQIDSSRKNVPVHKFAYEHYKGDVPVRHDVDHLCNVHHCVNPDHLEAVTPKENRRRRDLRKTHCKRNHPLSGANLYVCKRGKRSCKTCGRMALEKHKQKLL